jgi:3-methyladenine DNA glycosylase AlkD
VSGKRKVREARLAPGFSAIIRQLERRSDPAAVAGMARFGIVAKKVYGVPMPELRALARRIGPDRALARRLWAHGALETRLLASMIDDPERVTAAQMERWVRDFDSWAICDGCCLNLFRWTPCAWRKAVEWAGRDGEFVRRAGFVLMATLAVGDKRAPDAEFVKLLPLIEEHATDRRNFVKKAVNWALRQIGKRNLRLHGKALAAARRIRELNFSAARWIAADAIRELTSRAVVARLAKKS